MTGKAYTIGERVLRFDAIAHDTAELRCGKMIDKFAEIVTRLAGIAERFATALECVDTGFIRDAILDGLPTGVRLGATRIGCATRCAPPGRWRRRLTGSPPPSSPPRGTPAPGTITSATASTRRPTARPNWGKRLDKPGRTRRYHVPPLAHHRRPAHPARPAHLPDPRRSGQPCMGHKQTRALGTR